MKNIFKFIFLILIVFGLFFVVYYDVFKLEKEDSPLPINHVRINDQKIIRVETVASVEDRTLGLSGRESLGEDQGMLFVFDTEGQYFFWMKDMNFPIDIIWMNKEREVIYIKKSATPESYPDLFGPDKNSIYVLEVVAGFSDRFNIKEGDKLQFLP